MFSTLNCKTPYKCNHMVCMVCIGLLSPGMKILSFIYVHICICALVVHLLSSPSFILMFIKFVYSFCTNGHLRCFSFVYGEEKLPWIFLHKSFYEHMHHFSWVSITKN